MGVSGRVCVVALVAVCLQALCVSVSGLNLRLQRELLRVSSHDAMERCGNAGVSLPAFADHVLGPITSTFRGQCHPEAYQIPHKRAYICKLFPQTAHAPLHSVTTPPGSPSPSTLGRSTTKPVSPSGSPKVKHTPKPGSPSGGSPSASPPLATPTLRRSASLSASHIANPSKLKAEAPTYNALVLIEDHLTLMPITPTFFRDLAAKFGEMPTDERPWLYAVDIAGNMIIAPEKQVPGSEDKVCHGNLIPGATPGRRSAKATPPVHGEEHHTGDFRGVARQGGEIFADPHEDASHHRKWYWNNKSGFSLARVKPHEIEEAMGAIPRERIKKELKKIAGPEIATDNLVATFCLLGNQGLTIPAVHSENETKDHVTPITCPRITPTAGALDSLQIVVFSRKKRNALEIAADAAKDKEKEKEAHGGGGGGGHAPLPPPSSSLPPPPPPHEPAHKP